MKKTTQPAPALWVSILLVVLYATFTRAANAPVPVTADELGGSERYLTYLSTDKPVYRAGETVYLRTVFLNAKDNTPLQSNRNTIDVKISGPKGDVIHEGKSFDTDSVIGYQWQVPEGTAGGQYTAKITSPTLGTPETERVFDIRAFRAPRIKSQIQFTRDGYGPGDQVRASVSMERAEGAVPQGARVTAIARVDGIEIYRGPSLQLDNTGVIDAVFNLPEQIDNGEGSLSFVIEDGGIVETAIKSLPILLSKIDIEFYPESGDLTAGLRSRIYFQARLSNGKPTDVQGYIVELQGSEPGTHSVAEFKSTHEGRGRFEFTPQQGKQYTAIFTAPSGISTPAALPTVKNTGTVITSSSATYNFADQIELTIASNAAQMPTRLTLHKRELLLDEQSTELNDQNKNSSAVQLDAKDAEGVLIATAWDAAGHPLAERLIYRKPRFGLNIELQLSEGPFIPGAEVSVDVLTTDDTGKPVEAVVGLTVTDDTVLELIEKREQAPRLPVMVYLENEVPDLADAHVYLDRDNPQAGTAIDLLLGSQGWRRFVLVDYDNVKNQFPQPAARVMAQASPRRQLVRMVREVAAVRGMNANVQMMAVQENADAIAVDAIAAVDGVLVEAQLAQPNALPPQAAQQRPAIQPAIEPAIEIEEQLEAQDNAANKELAPAGADLAIAADRNMLRAKPVNTGFIREFAFQTRANRKPNDRVDFTETLYWNSGVKTGARDGRATVKFSLSDSVTTFRVLADGYGRNGALGSADTVIASVEPFYISTKLPQHAVSGDIIELPVTLVNTTEKPIDNASLSVTGNGIETAATASIAAITLAPGERLRHIVKVATLDAGKFPITVTAHAGPYADTVTRHLTVHPAGFPVSVSEGGLLSSTSNFSTTLTIPADVSPGSIVATAKVYPSPLASMEEALSALLRQPHGCFEQASSTNYPLVMAQQYFNTHTGVDPDKIATAQSLLKTGYNKLISFESQDNGYEWFGANPAHEALTAYGLMEFTDMAKVMQVDTAMIDRTRQWLLDRRDGHGSFKRNERALDSFGRAPAPTTDAYIVWSILESGENPQSLAKEIEQVKASAFNGNDSYIIALAANILYLADDKTSADLLLEKLASATSDSGAVDGSTTSITGSGGDALTIETTSLALLAWLRNDEQWAAQVEQSIKWLFERSKSGRFGSTQSTILALKAINAYDAARAVPKQPGSVQLYVNGNAFGQPVAFNETSKGAIELPDFSSELTTGQHQVELRMADGSKMPFALEVTYNTPLPNNAATLPVSLTTTLSHSQVPEGEPVELHATITVAEDNVPTPIAIIGIPAGLELRHDQLKELVGKDSISAYEVRDSELILYWRALKAGETRVIPVSLTADIPGTYTSPASRIYPYYTDEQKLWHAGHTVTVLAK